MLIVLSPAKTLDFESPAPSIAFTQPNFISESASLITELRKRSPVEIAQMMSLSDKLVALNMTRYEAWSKKFTLKNSKHALLAFNGDVYEGEWGNNKRNYYGIMKYSNGEVKDGIWDNDVFLMNFLMN